LNAKTELEKLYPQKKIYVRPSGAPITADYQKDRVILFFDKNTNNLVSTQWY
jgi:hypothetical protein